MNLVLRVGEEQGKIELNNRKIKEAHNLFFFAFVRYLRVTFKAVNLEFMFSIKRIFVFSSLFLSLRTRVHFFLFTCFLVRAGHNNKRATIMREVPSFTPRHAHSKKVFKNLVVFLHEFDFTYTSNDSACSHQLKAITDRTFISVFVLLMEYEREKEIVEYDLKSTVRKQQFVIELGRCELFLKIVIRFFQESHARQTEYFFTHFHSKTQSLISNS